VSKTMQPFEQRVVEELKELVEKHTKLVWFLKTDTYSGLDPMDKELLLDQSRVMASYARILSVRIARMGYTLYELGIAIDDQATLEDLKRRHVVLSEQEMQKAICEFPIVVANIALTASKCLETVSTMRLYADPSEAEQRSISYAENYIDDLCRKIKDTYRSYFGTPMGR